MASKNRRAIHFDLKKSLLKKYYTKKDYKQAYKDIRLFMENNGFTHRQWSGYFSVKPLTFADLTDIIDEMWNQFPWLEKCATKFDVTNIGKTYDLLGMHTKDKAVEKNESKNNDFKDRVKSAQQKADKINMETAKNISPKRDKGQEL